MKKIENLQRIRHEVFGTFARRTRCGSPIVRMTVAGRDEQCQVGVMDFFADEKVRLAIYTDPDATRGSGPVISDLIIPAESILGIELDSGPLSPTQLRRNIAREIQRIEL